MADKRTYIEYKNTMIVKYIKAARAHYQWMQVDYRSILFLVLLAIPLIYEQSINSSNESAQYVYGIS